MQHLWIGWPKLQRARRLTSSAVWLAVVATTAGVPPLGPGAARADDVARGRALAERLCANCHMNPGQGEKTGPDTVPGFVAVAKRSGQTLEGIITWLRAVPPMMPDHHLTQDEMQALAFFILSLAEDGAR